MTRQMWVWAVALLVAWSWVAGCIHAQIGNMH